MKKLYFAVAALSCMMMATSCEDMLDITQKGTVSTDTFYKTDADAESARTAMYATYISEIGCNEGIWSAYITLINYSADDVFAAGGDINDHADFRIFNEFSYDASSGCINTLYNHIYKAIYSANLVINYFGGEKADTPTKKQAVAEARVMRAWAHMLAAQVFCCPPLVDHLIVDDIPTNAEAGDLDADGNFTANAEKTKAYQKKIFDWCASECEAAMPDLKDRSDQSDKEGSWYATKGFAQFVGGKAALFGGDNAKAASMLKPLVESSNYALVPGERFRDLFHVEGDGCEEKIFEFNFTTNMAMGEWGGNIQRGRWMVANVINWRGDDIVGGGKSPKICSTGGWGGGSINQDFAHKMLENDGDSYRRKATFLTSDEFFYDETLCGWNSDDIKDEDGNIIGKLTYEQKQFDDKRGIRKEAGSFSRSDVMEVKMMMHPNDQGYSDSNNNTNLCLARLGEAYLLYAEACIASGNNAEAKKYINKIQERAGSKTISADVNLQVLQDEKQYEMWFEGCRYFDIVRWGIAKQCYDKVLDNIPLQWDEYWTSGGTKPHKLYYSIHHPFADAGIKLSFEAGKNEYFPLPQTVLEVNKEMHQVRGWAN